MSKEILDKYNKRINSFLQARKKYKSNIIAVRHKKREKQNKILQAKKQLKDKQETFRYYADKTAVLLLYIIEIFKKFRI